MNRNRSLAALPALAAIGMLVAGCGSDSSGNAAPTDHSTMDMSTMSAMPSPSAPASTAGSAGSSTGSSTGKVTLTIKDYAYSGPASVSPGATITVVNQDQVAHTVTADSAGGFDVMVPAGGSATFKAPAKAGSYPYHCTYHGNMHGTLKVS